MKTYRIHGLALALGAGLGLATMTFHPTHIELHSSMEAIIHANAFNTAIHTIGLISLPLTFFGYLGLTKLLKTDHALGIFGLIVFGMASFAVMMAAVSDGIIGPSLVGQIAMAEEPKRQMFLSLLSFNFETNQAFAKVYVVASSLAFFLWSIALYRSPNSKRKLGTYGIFVSGGALLGLVSGHLHMDAHGFGLIILLQTVWALLLANYLYRIEEN